MGNNQSKDLVVLLHGILRSKTDMALLSQFFKSHDYNTLNILYPSREKNLEELSDFVREKIESCPDYDGDTTIHFVTHSMGGLVTRYYIAREKPTNLGSVVMLGPPNTGSEFADWLSETEVLAPIFKTIFGPASAQLSTKYKHLETEIDYPLGVIAGNASVNPLAPWILDGEHDGIVPVERTKIEGMKDHIVMQATHSFMMFNKSVMEQALYFLQNEEFNHLANDGH